MRLHQPHPIPAERYVIGLDPESARRSSLARIEFLTHIGGDTDLLHYPVAVATLTDLFNAGRDVVEARRDQEVGRRAPDCSYSSVVS